MQSYGQADPTTSYKQAAERLISMTSTICIEEQNTPRASLILGLPSALEWYRGYLSKGLYPTLFLSLTIRTGLCS